MKKKIWKKLNFETGSQNIRWMASKMARQFKKKKKRARGRRKELILESCPLTSKSACEHVCTHRHNYNKNFDLEIYQGRHLMSTSGLDTCVHIHLHAHVHTRMGTCVCIQKHTITTNRNGPHSFHTCKWKIAANIWSSGLCIYSFFYMYIWNMHQIDFETVNYVNTG